MKTTIIFLVFFCLFFESLQSSVWRVGAGRQYATPSAVVGLVSDGDTVLIDAGNYTADVCSWRANNLLLRGEGGRAKLSAGGKSAEQKAIWVIKGDNCTIENIEFSDCKVADHNGAGIRQEGTNLVVRNCAFRRNEMGILAGNNIKSTILIEYSEFERSGYGDGYSHNIYINHIYRFIFRYNYSHHALIGHECKSRAHRNEILYNRLSNENGHASREIDLPNGGFSIIMGNIIHQGINAENSNIIGYGLEGLSDSLRNELYVVNNTIVNERPAGVFVQTQSGTLRTIIRNNFLIGAGSVFGGGTNVLDSGRNIRSLLASAGFTDALNYDYRLTEGSPAIAAAATVEPVGEYSLTPTEEYVHLAWKRDILPPLGAVFSAGAYQFAQANEVAERCDTLPAFFTAQNGTLRIEIPGNFKYKIWDIYGRMLAEGEGTDRSEIRVNSGVMAVEIKSAGLILRRVIYL
ncbi:right-handed parallel beta-helix repeat-containing protein [Ignavibacteria bacterium]|nr:hypothetical protein [Bacteroidota bacterium]